MRHSFGCGLFWDKNVLTSFCFTQQGTISPLTLAPLSNKEVSEAMVDHSTPDPQWKGSSQTLDDDEAEIKKILDRSLLERLG